MGTLTRFIQTALSFIFPVTRSLYHVPDENASLEIVTGLTKIFNARHTTEEKIQELSIAKEGKERYLSKQKPPQITTTILGTASIAGVAMNDNTTVAMIHASLTEAYATKVQIDRVVVERLLSKKLDNQVREKFLQVAENLREEQVTFRPNPIRISASLKVLEIGMLKDWRIYVRREGENYTICQIGHKNEQLRDIRQLKKRLAQLAG